MNLLSLSNHLALPMFFLKSDGESCVEDERIQKTIELRKELKEKYGDQYDLSRVVFINTRTPIELGCRKHGFFKQKYITVTQGQGGCKDCRLEERKEALTKQFKAVHGDRYDYTDMEIDRMSVKVRCREHGDFWVTHSSHAKSTGAGCMKCKQEEHREELIRQYREVHGDKYDYSEMEYSKSHIKIRIRCPEHGVFEQLPTAHREGQGCPKCAGRYDIENLKQLFNEVHNNRYIYIRIPNAQKRSKITFLCVQHGQFEVSVQKHLDGVGCPICEK